MDCSANQQSYDNGSELVLMGEQVAGVSCNAQQVSLTTSSGKSKVIVDKNWQMLLCYVLQPRTQACFGRRLSTYCSHKCL